MEVSYQALEIVWVNSEKPGGLREVPVCLGRRVENDLSLRPCNGFMIPQHQTWR